MDSKKTGKLIAKLRKEAGYTQASLASALYITDKAVSKWERGLSIPDTSLLPKLSVLLDADIEHLIAGKMPYGLNTEWTGLLIAKDINYDLYDKPAIYYLLFYFLLVGITNIEMQTNNKKYIDSLNLKQYGINISYTKLDSKKKMIVYDKALLFGVNLTRQFQDAMSKDKDVCLSLNNEELPILFSKHNYDYIEQIKNNCEIKNLGRGTIKIPLKTKKNIEDAREFIRIYQKYNDMKIADLQEIAITREIINI